MLPFFRSTIIALLLTSAMLGGCDSPPRMWGKRIQQAMNERPPIVPREKFERAASDAAMADALARLCGVDTEAMEPAMLGFLNHRDVQRPDILWDGYRLRRDRLVEENRLTTFHPGECWQRGQDFNDVFAAIKAGEFPQYDGFDLWK